MKVLITDQQGTVAMIPMIQLREPLLGLIEYCGFPHKKKASIRNQHNQVMV